MSQPMSHKQGRSNAGLNIDALDDVILSRIRLGVMAYLSSINPASFPELASRLETTNGNLSTHLSKLEKAGYVRLEKGYNGKRPQTLISLTDTGHAIWLAYLREMEKLI